MLQRLPSELLLEIFISLPHIRAASAFSKTCRTFYQIWRANIPAVCTATLPRMIPNLDLAIELYEVQLKTVQSYLLRKNKHRIPHNPVTWRTYALLANQDQATRAQAQLARGAPIVLTSDSPTFFRAWYKAMTLIILCAGRVTVQPFLDLDEIGLRELDMMTVLIQTELGAVKICGSGRVVGRGDGVDIGVSREKFLIRSARHALSNLLQPMFSGPEGLLAISRGTCPSTSSLLGKSGEGEARGRKVREALSKDFVLLESPAGVCFRNAD